MLKRRLPRGGAGRKKSALQGKRIRELTIELFRQWLAETEPQNPAQTSGEWIAAWTRLADKAMRRAPREGTAREILAKGRRRLERPE